MFRLLCGLATNTLRWLQLQAGERRRGALKLSVKILWIGTTSLLWSQSHNLHQRTIPVKLCLPHFFIICFYPSNCCSLLLWHTVAHLSLSLSAYGISQSLLYISFPLAKTPCFCLWALCCNSSKCPGYQYFISKYISLTISSFAGATRYRWGLCQSAEQISMADKTGDFIIMLFKFIKKTVSAKRLLMFNLKDRELKGNLFDIYYWDGI